MKSNTETLIKALEVLAQEIQSPDGVANAAITEAAERLRELSNDVLAQRIAELDRKCSEQAKVIEKLQQRVEELEAEAVPDDYIVVPADEWHRLVNVEGERDSLAAYVDQLRDLLIRVVSCEEYIFDSDLIVAVSSDLASEISEALDATPAQQDKGE